MVQNCQIKLTASRGKYHLKETQTVNVSNKLKYTNI